jgi:hypothetical protein
MQINDVHAIALQLLNSDSSDYEPVKLMSYTNPGIFYINNLRIAAKDPETIKKLVVSGTIDKPTDFFAFSPATASYPLIVNGNTIELSPGAPPTVSLKYTTKPAIVSNQADTFPLPDEYADMVASYIAIRLKKDNKQTKSVEWDFAILDRETNALIKAKGG